MDWSWHPYNQTIINNVSSYWFQEQETSNDELLQENPDRQLLGNPDGPVVVLEKSPPLPASFLKGTQCILRILLFHNYGNYVELFYCNNNQNEKWFAKFREQEKISTVI